MTDDLIGIDQTTNEIIAYEISDDALENAASTGADDKPHVLFLHSSGSLSGP